MKRRLRALDRDIVAAVLTLTDFRRLTQYAYPTVDPTWAITTEMEFRKEKEGRHLELQFSMLPRFDKTVLFRAL